MAREQSLAESAATRSPTDTGASPWGLYGLLFVAALVLIMLQLRREAPPNEYVGRAMPPLVAAGWLNVDQPLSVEDLRGKLVLVDFWRTDCPQCVIDMPELVKLKDRYRDQGLVVIGLTPEPDSPFYGVKRYVESVDGLDWPIGYGAFLPFEQLGVEFTPTYVLFDRSRRAVWGGYDLEEAEEAIIDALARG
jgi:thiol-disulfide isomerase/thioredoxin